MAVTTTYKVLGQSAPADTNNANLYTVPASTEAVISSLIIANTTGTAATCRVFVRINAAAAAASNAILYDASVAANSVATFTLGITVDATDVITVQSGTANALTFHAYGSEIA
jgi:hypothetical protein